MANYTSTFTSSVSAEDHYSSTLHEEGTIQNGALNLPTYSSDYSADGVSTMGSTELESTATSTAHTSSGSSFTSNISQIDAYNRSEHDACSFGTFGFRLASHTTSVSDGSVAEQHDAGNSYATSDGYSGGG